jgi:hypothetical protein
MFYRTCLITTAIKINIPLYEAVTLILQVDTSVEINSFSQIFNTFTNKVRA